MAGDETKSPAADKNDDEDPFNEENLINILTSPNRNMMDFSFIESPPQPLAPKIETDQSLQDLALPFPDSDANNESLLDDDYTLSWDMFQPLSDDLNINNVPGEIEIGDDNNANANGDGNGNNVVETTRLEVSTRVFGEDRTIFETGGPSTLPVPVTPTISDGIWLCTCCNLLRKLVHTNGWETMRLEIHGGIGFFCHAILETERFDDPTGRRLQTINLRELGLEAVKKYIEDYCTAREANGLWISTDTNASFYQAMNAGSNPNPIPLRGQVSLAMLNEALNNIPHVPLIAGPRDEVEPPKERPRRQTPLAAQRERTGKMTLKDLGQYFNLPIEEAASKMNMCPTVVKKICRRGGLLRWPHRKIKSLEKKISALSSVLRTTKDAALRAQFEEEIQKLRNEINEICREALKNSQ